MNKDFSDTTKGYGKLLYSLFSVTILIFMVTTYFMYRTDYKEDAFQCASYYDADYLNSKLVPLLYWQQDGICCHYALIDNNIGEECG